MKAQLSFEFLIYMAVSGISLAVMLGMFIRAQSVQNSMNLRSYVEELAASINANMNYRSSSFSAYVPSNLCNATVVNGTLVTVQGSFQLDGQLELLGNALCQSTGSVEQLDMTETYNGTYQLYR